MASYEDPDIGFEFPFLKVSQPIGDFYLASIPAKKLVDITYFDVRRVMRDQRDVEKYLGVQRELSAKRTSIIKKYINAPDACFPTAVIIAVDERCVEVKKESNTMVLHNYITGDPEQDILYANIARVLDGQHRLAGLEDFIDENKPEDEFFDINVSIFVDADLSDQASIFSTVNLAQTKVNKSLVYDLYDLAEARSPQKVCHNIAVTLDNKEGSPFEKMIKRLGVSTLGRKAETLTQATFIEPLLKMISADPMEDRALYLRRKKPRKISTEELSKHPFQHYLVDEDDYKVIDIIWNYFDSVRDRWPDAWSSTETGMMLNRTNGYKAFMRFLNHLYKNELAFNRIPGKSQFLDIFNAIDIEDNYFSTDNYKPGTAGETRLFKDLVHGSPTDD